MGSHHSDILVIGAGMAGLTCATRLASAGKTVMVLDKGRGPGGRMAARRAELGGEQVSFDHGAQYFTARGADFKLVVEQWQQTGVVAPWPAAGDDAWVGVPGMNAPIRAMAQEIDVKWGVRAESLTHNGKDWCAIAGDDRYCASTVLIAVPAEQAQALLAEAAPDFADVAKGVSSEPCWAVMAAFSERLDIDDDALRDADAAIAWAARNSAKPGRAGEECWVLHASPSYSRKYLDLPKDEVAPILLGEFFAQTGAAPVEPTHCVAHRWLYAMSGKIEGAPARFDTAHSIGIAGDYLHSPRVEGAFESGAALAKLVIEGIDRY